MLSAVLVSIINFAGPASVTTPTDIPASPGDVCRSEIRKICSLSTDVAQAACEELEKAFCEVVDAARWRSLGDIRKTLSELEMARSRYHEVIASESHDDHLKARIVVYAQICAQNFEPMSRGRQYEALVDFLEAEQKYLMDNIRRVPSLASDETVMAAVHILDELLAKALFNSGNALCDGARPKQAKGRYQGAADDFAEAAKKFLRAGSIHAASKDLYAELEGVARAGLARALESLAQNPGEREGTRAEAHARACAEYPKIERLMAGLECDGSDEERCSLRRQAAEAARRCAAPPPSPRWPRAYKIVPAVLGAVGVGLLGTSAGLYTNYHRACDYDGMTCSPITDLDDQARYTTQVHAAIGLVTAGLALGATSITLAIVGGVRASKRPSAGRLSIAPAIAPRFQGIALGFRF